VNGFIDHFYTQQAVTALPRISTQHPLSLFQPVVTSSAVPWQQLLTVEILQLHALRFYLHSLPCRTQLSTVKSTISHSLLSLPCRAQLNCQPLTELVSQSYVTTDGQSAGLSWITAPIWGLRPDLYFCQTVFRFLDVGRSL
jgi:hypothetical protein